jgi:hypothetical protein
MGQIIEEESRGGCVAAPKIFNIIESTYFKATYIRDQEKMRETKSYGQI